MNEHVKRNKEKLNVNGHFSSSISLFCPLFSLLAHGGPIHYNSQSIAGMMRKRNRANFFASRFSFRSFRRYTCKIKWKSSLRAEWMHKKTSFRSGMWPPSVPRMYVCTVYIHASTCYPYPFIRSVPCHLLSRKITATEKRWMVQCKWMRERSEIRLNVLFVTNPRKFGISFLKNYQFDSGFVQPHQ